MELTQALILTLVGMGMTFAAIGGLVAGMYALTALVKDKPEAVEAPVTESPAVSPQPLVLSPQSSLPNPQSLAPNPRHLAAAVAVSIALAEAAQSSRHIAAAAAVATALAEQSAPAAAPVNANAWNMVVRARRLMGRSVYDTRRKPRGGM
jgi:hypothetical protein